MAENSPQKEIGLAYANWWMSPEAQTAWGDGRGDVPFNPMATVSDQGLADSARRSRTGLRARDALLRGRPDPILNVALEQFGAFIANPGDPLPYLQTIQDEADEYWADQE